MSISWDQQNFDEEYRAQNKQCKKEGYSKKKTDKAVASKDPIRIIIPFK